MECGSYALNFPGAASRLNLFNLWKSQALADCGIDFFARHRWVSPWRKRIPVTSRIMQIAIRGVKREI
jgi:hypothetical protein